MLTGCMNFNQLEFSVINFAIGTNPSRLPNRHNVYFLHFSFKNLVYSLYFKAVKLFLKTHLEKQDLQDFH